MTLNLLGLSGALRAASTNTKLLHEAARLFGPCDFTQADLRLPLYDGDLEAEGIPAEVMTLAEQIRDADAVVISTPEYNKMISGVLKNALDWVSRSGVKPWEGKPVAILSAAAGRAGGERAQYSLRWAMTPFNAHLLQAPEVLVADSSNAFDNQGRLSDPRTVDGLEKLMSDLRRLASE
ncbi:NADPH-dependent FMN reductase [Celeribacter halophilus]|uniref:NADPH-dependent FMN reductase n=1 Tax=Celeribacter halophilus TaxID=576117 RepID=UPI001C09B6E6|nr:NADPH-dependent FMN reductase [Celeribacter halophilus]MBU2889992.1 NAD(P)H-dependent oxidoreductase [Celeribacter halophilus]MDO6511395.1 NADPH-dependent FMN reductase [Celeribacter halophilus]